MTVKKQQNTSFSPFFHYLCTRNSNYSDCIDTKQALQFLQGGEESEVPAGVLYGARGGD